MMKTTKGFTLVELMVVVAIMGILGAVGYPAYGEYVKKAKRADAIDTMLTEASRLEEFYLNNDSYVGAVVLSTTSPKGYYTIALSGADAYAYLLTATRSPADDSECTALTLNQLGQKGASGSVGDVTPEDCW